jgi:Ni,Fe-hydrogenase III large subunit
MTSSALVTQVGLQALPAFEIDAWRDEVLRRHRAGARLVALYGRRLNDRILVTTILRAPEGTLDVLRTAATETGYRALTPDLPAAHVFERELHEQTGLRIAGHPWLKPVRYEGQTQAAMSAHPFYRIEGKEVHEVAVGPIHAGVIEPGSFRFMCFGEEVHHLEIQLGYQHRGVEALLLQRDARRLGPLVETVAGDTSVAHAWAYCAALERLSGCELEMETEIARAVALELERVGMHLAGLSGLAADIGDLQGATTYGRLRTTVINTTMRLCGSRFGRGAVRPGGTGMRAAADRLAEIETALEQLRVDLAIINDAFLGARTVQHRLRGAGQVPSGKAEELGFVGMAARACGMRLDTRHPTRGAYAALPVELRVCEEGDCWARARLRIAEIDASLGWLQSALPRCVPLAPSAKLIGALPHRHLAVAVVEGWRGEVVHCLETDERGGLAHYKLQDPSLRNWMGLALAVRDNEISDFPICNKSFDLSYCGNDL